MKKDTPTIPAEYEYRNIGNYIKDEYSVCREERQYALFLYNILRNYSSKNSRDNLKKNEKTRIKDIFKACNLEDADVKYVFYEATFMRDFFKRDKRCAYADEESLRDKLLNITYKKEEHNDPYNVDQRHIQYEERFNYLLLEYVLNMPEKNKANSELTDSELREIMESIIEQDKLDRPDNIDEIKEEKWNSILDLNLGGNAGRSRMTMIINKIINEAKNKIKEDLIIEKIKRAKIMMLAPGGNRHSRAERNRQYRADRKSQCTSFSFL